MWSDNETNRDFLNFKIVAQTAAEMIRQAGGRPLSIGISGSWGVGKSSMLRLIHDELTKTPDSFIFVDFNAWLYQGYDDARAALMDVILQSLQQRADEKKTCVDKVQSLLTRVDWLRVAHVTAGPALALAMGLPPIGLVSSVWEAGKRLLANQGTAHDAEKLAAETGKAVTQAKTLIRPEEVVSPPKQIQELRKQFEALLKELDITLIVSVDDLDRCLPETAISTLEAIRLFAFLNHTAFIIAADDKMIRHAVRVHFHDSAIDDAMVTSYFDKLIQVPIRVPSLGTQDVRAYMILLYIENSTLEQGTKDTLRQQVCQLLAESWQGKRVDCTTVVPLLKGQAAYLRVSSPHS